jgi:hypothetical protein
MSGLSIILRSDKYEDAHYALAMASAALAVNPIIAPCSCWTGVSGSGEAVVVGRVAQAASRSDSERANERRISHACPQVCACASC